MPAYCEVALPVPLDRAFTYALRDDQHALRGVRVIAPFRNEKLIGVITGVNAAAPNDVEVRYLEAVLDDQPILSEPLLALAEWMAQYYLAPLGEVLRGMMPLAAEVKRQFVYRIADAGRRVLYEGATKGSSRRSKLTAEQQDILKSARAGEGSLRDVWEKKYEIVGDTGLRMKKRDEEMRKSWETDREKKDAEKRSQDALNVVTGNRDQPDLGTGPGVSAAFKTRFRTFEMDPSKPAVADNGGIPSLEVKPGQHVRQTGDRGPTGAQRAASKFLAGRSGTGTKAA